MAGSEIEDASVSAGEGHAASEDLAALVPGDEHGVVRTGDVEPFPVHLRMRQFEIFRQSGCDRMGGFHHPHAFPLADFAPAQIGGCSEHPHENFGFMAGVKNNQSHAGEDAFLDPVDDLVADLSVGAVPPPEQNVGIVEHFLGETMIRLFQRCRPNFKIPFRVQEIRNRLMDSFRIDRLYSGTFLLVPELVPYCDPDFFAHDSYSPFRD